MAVRWRWCFVGALCGLAAAGCVPNVGPAGPVRPGERCSVIGDADPLVAEQRTIFLGGDGRYPIYRIPAAVTTGSGVVLAFAEARPTTADPGSGLIDVVLRRSEDCGRTWGGLQVVGDAGVDDAHNPTAVAAAGPGGVERVLLFYGQRPASPGGEFDLPSGFGPGTATMWMRTSGDDGATWDTPRDITAQIKDPSWRVASFGPGQAIVTRWGTAGAPAGRIVVPGWYSSDAVGVGSFILYSDDGGSTWTRRTMPAGGTTEAQLIERVDGTLVLDARGGSTRQLFTSSDGGDTWSGPSPGLAMAPIMSGLHRDRAVRDGDAFDRILQTGIATDGRYDLRIWASRDEGATWTPPVVLAPGSAQYSMPVPLPDGTIGVVYESTCICDDGTGFRFGWSIRFLRLDPERVGLG